MSQRNVFTIAVCLLVCALPCSRTAAQTSLTLETLAYGFESPVAAEAPLGDDRVFVAEQLSGRIRIVSGGAILQTPFLDLAGKISKGGEQGLLDLAFHPRYATNGLFFVAFTDWSGATVVERYRVSTWDPNVADAGSAVQVLSVPQPYPNHNGGCIQFGPDGHLYVGIGDGGSADDPHCNGQSLSTLLGKILRIDVEPLDWTGTYGIPSDNPFVWTPGARGEIYAYGLRNPWRFRFDRENGDLVIGDVGELTREEVDYAHLGSKGLNFGWSIEEGTLCNGIGSCGGGVPACGSPSLRGPLHEYSHDPWGGACSITGGGVYRGCAMPWLRGTYFYADFCSGEVWSFRTDGWSLWELIERTQELAGPGGSLSTVTSFGEDGHGELLITSFSGTVQRIVPTSPGTACEPAIANFQRGSIASGIEQALRLDAGTSHAWKPYLLLGTASGTWPGLWQDGVFVPLNWDAYFSAGLNGSAAGLLLGEAGLLDAEGRAHAGFSAAPGAISANLAGLTVHHAFLVLEPNGVLRFASNAVRLDLAP